MTKLTYCTVCKPTHGMPLSSKGDICRFVVQYVVKKFLKLYLWLFHNFFFVVCHTPNIYRLPRNQKGPHSPLLCHAALTTIGRN